MHASCTICGDIFTGADPEIIKTTLCGHMFHQQCLTEWLQRSKTCPQCRAKVDERSAIKLYFQLSSLPTQDTGTLENIVQNLKYQLKLKDIDVNKMKEGYDAMQTQLAGLKKLLKEAESKIRTNETIVNGFKDQIKVLKMQAKSYCEEKLRNEELEKQLETYANIEKVLKGSVSDAVETLALMKEKSDPGILCACISNLKREIQTYKEKSRDLQSLLKLKETKLSSALTELNKQEKQISILNRSLTKVKEDLLHTESESENLKKKCKHLEEAIMSPPGTSSGINPRDKALRRFINEYPVPVLKDSPTIEVSIPSTSKGLKKDLSPPSPVMLNQDRRFLLNKRRLHGGSSASTDDLPCFDGLGGHIKEEVTMTDRATLLRTIENSKSSKILLNKRFKSNKTETPKTSMLNFITKK